MNQNSLPRARRRGTPWLFFGAVNLFGFIGLIIGGAVGVASPKGSPGYEGAVLFCTIWVIIGILAAPTSLVVALNWSARNRPPVSAQDKAAAEAQRVARANARQARSAQSDLDRASAKRARAERADRAREKQAQTISRFADPASTHSQPAAAVSAKPAPKVAEAVAPRPPKRGPAKSSTPSRRNAPSVRPELAFPRYPVLAARFANYEVVGGYYRQDSVIKAFGGLTLNVEKTLDDVETLLIPEPENKHGKGNAVMIWMNGHHVGYLASEDSARYRPVLDRIVAAGYVPASKGRMWGISRFNEWDQKTKNHFALSLALNEPELLLPTNNPPHASYSLLPWGHAIQVTKEVDHMPELTEHLHGPESFAIATLKPAERQLKNGTIREYVTVHIDGDEIGEFTPNMSEKVLPLIRHLSDLELETAVWARVKGSVLAIEVSIHAARAHEVPDNWLASIPVTVPSLRVDKDLASPAGEAHSPELTAAREEKWDF